MIDIDEKLTDFPVITLKTGDYLLQQGKKSDSIYFLIQGAVKVIKDGQEVAVRSDKGSVLGEMSMLLDKEHVGAVICIEESRFYHIEHPKKYLEDHPEIICHIAEILALRLYNLTQYLVDVQRQYEGHDHLNMVDDVLETLLNQQKSRVLQRGESKRETPDY